MDEIVSDIITGFIAVGVACILAIDLAAQIRLRSLCDKIDLLLARINK